MMRSPLTTFLTASRFMRALYGVAKAVGFVFLAGLVAARLVPGSGLGHFYGHVLVRAAGWAMVYTALALAIIRGVPVLLDALVYLQKPNQPAERS
jgi:CDP-diacylglycerol--glycerol-3-phosphate 3-phosphatidyltransferase